MNEVSIEIGISVLVVKSFHALAGRVPWVERQTDKALTVVSVTVAVLSSVGITFAAHGSVLTIGVEVPVLIRFVLNAAVQHGMIEVYHALVFRRPPPRPASPFRPSTAGPILPWGRPWGKRV